MKKIALNLLLKNHFRLSYYIFKSLTFFNREKYYPYCNLANFLKKRKSKYNQNILKEFIKPRLFIFNIELDTQDIINKIYDYEDIFKKNEFTKDGHENIYQSEHTLNKKEEFKQLSQKLEVLLNLNLSNFFNDIKIKIHKMWFVITQDKGIIKKHSHFDSDLSGVLYLKVDENPQDKLGSLKIYNIFKNLEVLKYNDNEKKFNVSKVNEEYFYFTPKLNSLIIFNSYIEHSVENSSSNNDRISLPIDCKFN